MKNFFLDTNVVIDFLANREPFAAAATQLFDLAEKGHITLYISALSYANIYFIIKKTCSHKTMISILRDLESLMETVDVTKQVINAALNGDFKDFEDAIQYHSASTHKKINALVTRNVKDYKGTKLMILTPDEAISMIK